MPNIVCPSCNEIIYMEEDDYDGEMMCPECGALLYVVITGHIVEKVELLGEGFETGEWEEDLETWTEKEEEW